jgi:cytochrome c oxidase assembly protein Cox11
MIFFGIINIPLFKYFCEIPNLDINSLDNTISNNINNDIKKGYFKLGIFDNIFQYNNILLYYNNNLFFIIFKYFENESNFLYFFLFEYLNNNKYFFIIVNKNYDVILNYIEVIFKTSSTNYNFIEFICLQNSVFVLPNETHLVFFRIYNSIEYDFTGISIYLVFPTDYLIFFNKIQCFCFEEIFLFPLESIDLPIIFNILGDIKYELDFFYSNSIYLSYLFLIK